MNEEIDKFIGDQLSVWPMASANFRSMKAAEQKDVTVFGLDCRVQFNPERVASSTASVDAASIAARPCFLCETGRPAEQFHIGFEGRKGRRYHIQVNPFPIFSGHLVVARDIHTPQSIWHNFVDMMDFARDYDDYLVYYNGPMSGASAPDHMHFQAIHKGELPLQNAVDAFLDTAGEPLDTLQDAKLYKFPGYCRGVFALKADTPKSLAKLFYRLIDCVPARPGEDEPRFNFYVYTLGSEFRCFVALRSNLRSHHYAAQGECHLSITCGCAEMAGVFVAPFREDFDRATGSVLEEILDEVTPTAEEEQMIAWRLKRKQLKIDVKVLWGSEIRFEIISDGAGPQKVSLSPDGRLLYGGAVYDELYFDSVTRSTNFAEPSFILHSDFGPLRYAGSVKFYVENGEIVASNHVGVENYLLVTLSGKTLPEGDLESYTVGRRTALLAEGAQIPAYMGYRQAPDPRVRAALDVTWGKTIESI